MSRILFIKYQIFIIFQGQLSVYIERENDDDTNRTCTCT